MSFHGKTGHFFLTISEAKLAFGINERDTSAIAARLRERGITVHEVCPAWVRCDMRPVSIWNAFHDGKPDPLRMASYWTRTAKTLYPEWAAEEINGLADRELAESTSSH